MAKFYIRKLGARAEGDKKGKWISINLDITFGVSP